MYRGLFNFLINVRKENNVMMCARLPSMGYGMQNLKNLCAYISLICSINKGVGSSRLSGEKEMMESFW